VKIFLIALGIVVLVGGVVVVIVLFKAAGIVNEAHGRALYSSIGAWTRIQEYARTHGNTNHIAEANKKVELIEHDLKQWREQAVAMGLDLASFEKARTSAYETTDQNIKSGQNPLIHLEAPQ
jgi:hypothetical protein